MGTVEKFVGDVASEHQTDQIIFIIVQLRTPPGGTDRQHGSAAVEIKTVGNEWLEVAKAFVSYHNVSSDPYLEVMPLNAITVPVPNGSFWRIKEYDSCVTDVVVATI